MCYIRSVAARKETPLRQPEDRSDILLPFYSIVLFSLFKTRLPAAPSLRGARGVFLFRYDVPFLSIKALGMCHIRPAIPPPLQTLKIPQYFPRFSLVNFHFRNKNHNSLKTQKNHKKLAFLFYFVPDFNIKIIHL